VRGECTTALYIISGAKRSPRRSRKEEEEEEEARGGRSVPYKKQNLTKGVRKKNEKTIALFSLLIR